MAAVKVRQVYHSAEGDTEGAPLYVMTKQQDGGRWLLHACQNTQADRLAPARALTRLVRLRIVVRSSRMATIGVSVSWKGLCRELGEGGAHTGGPGECQLGPVTNGVRGQVRFDCVGGHHVSRPGLIRNFFFTHSSQSAATRTLASPRRAVPWPSCSQPTNATTASAHAHCSSASGCPARGKSGRGSAGPAAGQRTLSHRSRTRLGLFRDGFRCMRR